LSESGQSIESAALKTNLPPTLELESSLIKTGAKFVAGVDEVGRGALAGPVSVGVAVLDATVSNVPDKLRDSKLISKSIRENLVPELKNWVSDFAIGHASPAEIDEFGIIAALRLAWIRAFENLTHKPNAVILDGKHNWLVGKSNLFSETEIDLPVSMKIKADQYCASVAAASVLAKVERDQLMHQADSDFPQYGFAGNVGYGSAKHMKAIQEHGASVFHRRSWNLPIRNQ